MPLPPTGTQISINQITLYFGWGTSGTQRSMSQLANWGYNIFTIPPGTQVRLSATFGGWYYPPGGYN